MPVRMRKLPRKRKWRVYDGKKVVAKATTKPKAERQVKLLRGLEHGMTPRKRE